MKIGLVLEGGGMRELGVSDATRLWDNLAQYLSM